MVAVNTFTVIRYQTSERGKRKTPGPMPLGAIPDLGLLLTPPYLSLARKPVHATELNGNSGLLSVFESRTTTLVPCWPTSTHAPPLPPLRLALRQRGSRVSIAHSPLFGSGREMPPWGALQIVPARTCRGSSLTCSERR